MLIALLAISVDLTDLRAHDCAVLQTITSRILRHCGDPRDLLLFVVRL
jgi:hypothetical protein